MLRRSIFSGLLGFVLPLPIPPAKLAKHGMRVKPFAVGDQLTADRLNELVDAVNYANGLKPNAGLPQHSA